MLVSEAMLVKDHTASSHLSNRLQAYLQSLLHVRVNLTRWDKTASLPLFLTKEFEFLQAPILSVPCLFAILDNDSDATPTDLAKRQEHLQKHAKDPVIFVFDHMSASARARLIEKGVSFVVPDNQLYIPSLAMDLCEHFRARPAAASSTLSPVAQVVLFRHLLIKNPNPWSPSRLAKDLRYSAMSIGRAFEELSAHGFAKV